MGRKRKKAAAFLTALALAASLLPAALAADSPQGLDLCAGGDRSGEGWSWDSGAKVLTLDGAALDAGEGDALCLPDGSTIRVERDSTVSSTAGYDPETDTETPKAILGEGALTITGPGTLTVTNAAGFGLFCWDDLVIDGGRVTVQSEMFTAVLTAGDLTIRGGSVVNARGGGGPDGGPSGV